MLNNDADIKKIEVKMAAQLPGWAEWATYALIVSFGYLAITGLTWPIYGLAMIGVTTTYLFRGAYNAAVTLFNTTKITQALKDILNEGTSDEDGSLSECKGEVDEEEGS